MIKIERHHSLNITCHPSVVADIEYTLIEQARFNLFVESIVGEFAEQLPIYVLLDVGKYKRFSSK